MSIEILGVREHPHLLDEATVFFYTAFDNQENSEVYYDCIKHSITTSSSLPRWFVALKNNRIIGGCGLITNDFISRMDLWPWLAALYVVEEERGQALGAKLLTHALIEAKQLGFDTVYLTTDHDGLYEKYDWLRIEDGIALGNRQTRIYKKSTS